MSSTSSSIEFYIRTQSLPSELARRVVDRRDVFGVVRPRVGETNGELAVLLRPRFGVSELSGNVAITAERRPFSPDDTLTLFASLLWPRLVFGVSFFDEGVRPFLAALSLWSYFADSFLSYESGEITICASGTGTSIFALRRGI